MHGSNLIFLLSEHYFIYNHEDCKSVGVLMCVVFSSIYGTVLYCCYYLFKVAIYPFLTQFTFVEYLGLALCSSIVLVIGLYVQKFFIPEEKQEEESINLADL